MSIENQFGFIGWCKEGTSDKCWGYFYRPTDTTPSAANWWHTPIHARGWNCCIFWGRRGKAMQFKADVTGDALMKLVASKKKKGYQQITSDRLIEIWPNFIQEAEAKLMWEVLAGNVK
jgi:predicted DNA-binding WGR domain protein